VQPSLRRLRSLGSVGSFRPSSRDPDEVLVICKTATHTYRASWVVIRTKAPPVPFRPWPMPCKVCTHVRGTQANLSTLRGCAALGRLLEAFGSPPTNNILAAGNDNALMSSPPARLCYPAPNVVDDVVVTCTSPPSDLSLSLRLYETSAGVTGAV
jgi:hypothetical protein